MSSKDSIQLISYHCKKIVDGNLADNLDSEIEFVNLLEIELNKLKRIINRKLEDNAQILKIAKLEYASIVKQLSGVERNSGNCVSGGIESIFLCGQKLDSKKYIKHKKLQQKITNIVNLDTETDEALSDFILSLKHKEDREDKVSILQNAIRDKLIFVENNDLGFNNKYTTYSIISIDERNINRVPFDILLYDKSINQIVIKLGNDDNYALVNTKLCRVYPPGRQTVSDNSRSIICNNNIQYKYWLPPCKEVDRKNKCDVNTCRYYHDPFLGDKTSSHKDRQFSNNPIVFSSNKNSPVHNFKSGEFVKENVKKTKWYEAITLYQSSLSNLLIACIHAQAKK